MNLVNKPYVIVKKSLLNNSIIFIVFKDYRTKKLYYKKVSTLENMLIGLLPIQKEEFIAISRNKNEITAYAKQSGILA